MTSIAQACAAALKKEGVIGVMAIDDQGLLLHSEGTVMDGNSGAIAELAQQGSALHGSDAVVAVESAEGKILLSRSGGATVALFMQQQMATA